MTLSTAAAGAGADARPTLPLTASPVKTGSALMLALEKHARVSPAGRCLRSGVRIHEHGDDLRRQGPFVVAVPCAVDE